MMKALAVIIEHPEHLVLRELQLTPPGDADVVVDIEWSGVSTGTERMLWSGRMPSFPGMGYPLVPGYESVGRVVASGRRAGRHVGERVFVPGARCFGEVRGLFGGAASRVVVPNDRVVQVDESLGERAVLLALAATAHHAVTRAQSGDIELIVGHGVLGRLLARIVIAKGGKPPIVWETNPARRDGAQAYRVVDPADDASGSYRTICDVSGDAGLLDQLIGRLSHAGEIVLAGFYERPLVFAFPPAFMREARISVAAQWQPGDLEASLQLVQSGRLSLDGLITHRQPAIEADTAYRTAFNEPSCLKMILDWRAAS